MNEHNEETVEELRHRWAEYALLPNTRAGSLAALGRKINEIESLTVCEHDDARRTK